MSSVAHDDDHDHHHHHYRLKTKNEKKKRIASSSSKHKLRPKTTISSSPTEDAEMGENGFGKSGFDVVVHGIIDCAECLEVGMLYCRTLLCKGPDWIITSPPSSVSSDNFSSYVDENFTSEEDFSEDEEGGRGKARDGSERKHPSIRKERRAAGKKVEDRGKSVYAYNSGSGERVSCVDIITQMSERLPGPVAKFVWNAPFECALRSTNVSGWPQLAIQLATINGAGEDVTVGYARCFLPTVSGSVCRELPLMQLVYSTPQQSFFGFFDKIFGIKGSKPAATAAGEQTEDLLLRNSRESCSDVKVNSYFYSPSFPSAFGTSTPELRDLSFLCSAEDRITMWAKRLPGYVRVTFNVMVSGQAALGYDV